MGLGFTFTLECHTTALIVLLLLVTANFTNALFDEKEIDAVFKETMKCHNNPGLAVSVVKDGKVIFSRGYGVTDLDTQEPVTDSTLFGIASVSKSFAATLLVKLLYEKTDLTVDSRVSKLMGNKFQMPDYYRTKLTTFADLMGHRTAVTPNNRIRFNNNITRENLIEYISELPAPYQFRVKYFYSNLMYGLVTYLAEVIGNSTWEQLVTEHLFEPLGMEKSTFATVLNFSRPDFATGYTEDRSGHLSPVPPEFSRHWALLAGSGAVVTSARDMVHWMNFHLYKGKNRKGRQIMASKHIYQVHKARMLMPPMRSQDTLTPRFPVTSSSNVYAHGFRRGFYRGYEKLTHTGSTAGYRAMMSLLPDQKIGVFTVLSGSDSNYVHRLPLHMYLMDKALGYDSWLNTSTICSYPEPWKSKYKKKSPINKDAGIKLKREISEYEGTYFNNAFGYLRISYNESLTSLVLTFGWGTWRLFSRPQYRGDKFYGDGIGITVIDVSPIEFIPSKRNTSVIGAVKATAFDTFVPPLFKKNDFPEAQSVSPTIAKKNNTSIKHSVDSLDMSNQTNSFESGNYSTPASNTTYQADKSDQLYLFNNYSSMVLSETDTNVTLEEPTDLKPSLDNETKVESIIDRNSSSLNPQNFSPLVHTASKNHSIFINKLSDRKYNLTRPIKPACLISSNTSPSSIHKYQVYLLDLASFLSATIIVGASNFF